VLRASGLHVVLTGPQEHAGVPPGIIVRQQPPAGSQLRPADAITIEVSK
jgi:beta-lactam-binding protein with PASTA domain